MSEQKKFWILVILLILSVILAWFAYQTMNTQLIRQF